MDLKECRIRPRPMRGAGRTPARRGAAWDWATEIAAAIAMVALDPQYRVVLCARAPRSPNSANLDAAAAAAGAVLERRIRPGGGWDVIVRAA